MNSVVFFFAGEIRISASTTASEDGDPWVAGKVLFRTASEDGDPWVAGTVLFNTASEDGDPWVAGKILPNTATHDGELWVAVDVFNCRSPVREQLTAGDAWAAPVRAGNARQGHSAGWSSSNSPLRESGEQNWGGSFAIPASHMRPTALVQFPTADRTRSAGLGLRRTTAASKPARAVRFRRELSESGSSSNFQRIPANPFANPANSSCSGEGGWSSAMGRVSWAGSDGLGSSGRAGPVI